MTVKDYSEKAFRDFMRRAVVAQLINPATARARKLAAEHLLAELKSHERSDMRLVDVDDLCARIHKLQDSTIRPESLAVYESRLKDALADFVAWTDDPKGFVPSDSEFRTTREQLKNEPEGHKKAREELALNPPRSPTQIFPVPIRENLVVYVQNVPLDMSPREAEKICAVVRALADPDVES